MGLHLVIVPSKQTVVRQQIEDNWRVWCKAVGAAQHLQCSRQPLRSMHMWMPSSRHQPL